MKKQLFQGPTGFVVALACIGCANAQIPLGTGERLAKEAMGLVAFAEMGNIGARDPECRGTPFPVADISSLVETEIVPIMDAMARVERKSNPTQRAEMIALLKQMPSQSDGGVGVIQRVYDQKKTGGSRRVRCRRSLRSPVFDGTDRDSTKALGAA
jgi:hypothetical protein